jgi:hypothetical protein
MNIMKTILFFLLIFISAATISLKAQVNDLGGNSTKAYAKKGSKRINLNGTVWMGYTSTKCQLYYGFRKNPTIVYGANLSYTLWHRLNLGISMTRFSNKFSSYWEWSEFSDWVRYMNGYYGGLFVEPILFPKYPVHVSFPIIIGAGSITEHVDYFQSHWPATMVIEEGHKKDSRSFWIFEPGIEIELNLLKYFRIGVGAKYSLTSKMNIDNGWNPVYTFSEPTFNLSLKFGRF